MHPLHLPSLENLTCLSNLWLIHPLRMQIPNVYEQVGMHLWLCQVVEGCLQACDTFKGLSKGPEGSLEQEVALLHIQANLVDIAQRIPGSASTTDSLAVAKGVHQLPPGLCYVLCTALIGACCIGEMQCSTTASLGCLHVRETVLWCKCSLSLHQVGHTISSMVHHLVLMHDSSCK